MGVNDELSPLDKAIQTVLTAASARIHTGADEQDKAERLEQLSMVQDFFANVVYQDDQDAEQSEKDLVVADCVERLKKVNSPYGAFIEQMAKNNVLAISHRHRHGGDVLFAVSPDDFGDTEEALMDYDPERFELNRPEEYVDIVILSEGEVQNIVDLSDYKAKAA